MGTLRRLLFLGEEAVPRGSITRLRLRLSVDLLSTLALAALALAATAAYQVLVHRRPGGRASWL